MRLLASREGKVTCEAAPLEALEDAVRLKLSPRPVDSSDRFLYHKTTRRRVYEQALRSCPGAEDVILWNERGEITETCFGNLVFMLDGELVTPPVSCGLLAGTFRAGLIEGGLVSERVITMDLLRQSRRFFRVNSVRRWQVAVLEQP